MEKTEQCDRRRRRQRRRRKMAVANLELLSLSLETKKTEEEEENGGGKSRASLLCFSVMLSALRCVSPLLTSPAMMEKTTRWAEEIRVDDAFGLPSAFICTGGASSSHHKKFENSLSTEEEDLVPAMSSS
ncbi:hypothetical protein Bca52824_052864 [Brassica carinata]|uniref:Uncharacterized protein n=1 Tax=Brassica carinata TaxID=52824 RepID=A0A8X7R334_BRACI|nr:hypothetical protein Bca52824_052864 [Brassica carinata]